MSSRKQNWDLGLAILSVLLLATALFLNYYRYEFFGVVPHSAPNNFWFNFTYFIPLTLASFLFSVIAFSRIIGNWKIRVEIRKKVITLILTIPIIVMFFLRLFTLF